VARRGDDREQPGAIGRAGTVESYGREWAMTRQKELEHWAAEGRPQSCPACGLPRIARILYGLPDFSKDLAQALSEGTVTLGGCLVNGDDPEWECLGCGQKIDASPKRRGEGSEPGRRAKRSRRAAKRPEAEGPTSRRDGKTSEFWRSKVARLSLRTTT
jgi:hypothetical protein